MSTIYVNAGMSLQDAINNAQPGDTLELESGAAWSNDLLFVEKSGEQPVTITCADNLLPAPGNRVTAEQSAAFPRLIGNHKTSPRAAGYIVRGLRFEAYAGNYTTGALDLGGSGINGDYVVRTVEELPRDWTVDRCWLQADPAAGGKRGIAANCAGLEVRDSVLSGYWSDFQDSQAIGCWNGPGPFEIINCTLEGAGENVMFGGAAPSIPNLVPSDILIEGCWVYKPLGWKATRRRVVRDARGRPVLREASNVKVKNLLEFKSGRRAQIRGNIFENNWTSAQSGFGILFTVRTCEAGDYPWACVEDIEFENNWVISENGTNAMGCDEQRGNCGPPTVAGDVHGIVIRNNIIQAQWLFQVMSGACAYTIERNTCNDNHAGAMLCFDTNPHGKVMDGLVCRDNLMRYGSGIIGSNAGPGTQALDMYWQTWQFEHNAVHGVPEGDMWWVADGVWYPPGNLYCVDAADVPEGEYGCDEAALQHELKHVRDGQTAANPQPPARVAILRVEETLEPGDYEVG